jgi:amino acid transporter
VDDREAGTYSTPPDAAPSAEETRAARRDMARGLPLLFGSVFITFVVVAVIILLAR